MASLNPGCIPRRKETTPGVQNESECGWSVLHSPIQPLRMGLHSLAMNHIVNRKVKGQTILLLFNASDISFCYILFPLILTKDIMIGLQFNEGGS